MYIYSFISIDYYKPLVQYEMRFDKKPKIVRKLLENEEPLRPNKTKADAGKKGPTNSNNQTKQNSDNNNKLPNLITSTNPPDPQDNNNSFSVSGTSISKSKPTTDDKFEERVLKPPPQFGGDNDLKQLANVISKEIYQVIAIAVIILFVITNNNNNNRRVRTSASRTSSS